MALDVISPRGKIANRPLMWCFEEVVFLIESVMCLERVILAPLGGRRVGRMTLPVWALPRLRGPARGWCRPGSLAIIRENEVHPDFRILTAFSDVP